MVKGIKSVLAFIFALTLIGCSNNETPDPELIVDNTSYQMEIGESELIDWNINNDSGNLTIDFSSENDEIVSVDTEGLMTAHKEGETTITVMIVEFPDNCIEIYVTVLDFPLTIEGDDIVYVGQTIVLVATDRNHSQNVVNWESLNPDIATVSNNGQVEGVSAGTTVIKIYSLVTDDTLEKSITVVIPEPESVEVSIKGNPQITVLNEILLSYNVLPAGASQDVIWYSSADEIATVDQDGKVFCKRSGTVDIVAKTENEIEGKITLNITVDPVEIIKSFNVSNPIAQYVTTYGNTEKTEFVYGSVSRYYPGGLNLSVDIIDITENIDDNPNPYIGMIATPEILNAAEFKTVRSGILKPEIRNIIYHDTGNNNYGADAVMHAVYIAGPDNFNYYKARSWHYTVDDERVIQHLPDDEVAWQGDTYEAYSTTIGVETCVDEGSNLYTTWHRTAKLMASLLVKHNLKVSDIKQHYDFSGKNCPQTLRRNNLYDNAISLIEAEYLVLTELEGYNISFISNAPEYVDNYGRIIKLDTTLKRVGYMVYITNDDGYSESVFLYSDLPAKTT